MKRIAACLVVSAFTASTALGGTVLFEAVSGDASTPNVFNVSIGAADAQAFSAIDMYIGSPDAALGYSFAFDPVFAAQTDFPATQGPGGLYDFAAGTNDWTVGGFRSATWSAPVLLGQLTVDVSGLSGPTLLQVSSAWETANAGGAFTALTIPGGGSEPLEGSVMLPIPEPATLMLLGLGGLAVLRRRKA